MKTLKNIKLTKAKKTLVGTRVPRQKYGNIGYFTQDTLSKIGYPINEGNGVDIPQLGIEVKSKCQESKSAYAIGSLSLEKIKELDYDHSPIKDKFQVQFQVIHSQNLGMFTAADTIDFSKESIQEKLRYAYNSAREMILNGCIDDYIRGPGACAYFERKKRRGGILTNNWAFRISVYQMQNLKSMAKSNFDNIFEIT